MPADRLPSLNHDSNPRLGLIPPREYISDRDESPMLAAGGKVFDHSRRICTHRQNSRENRLCLTI